MASSSEMAMETTRVFIEPGHYPRIWRYSTNLEELRGEPPIYVIHG